MRMIDADALPNELFKRHVHDGEELEPMMYFEDAVKVVEDAPTIDAIPVEWLRGYTAVGVAPTGDRLTEGKERLIVHRILNEWQKEQEAQDG